MHYNVMLRNDKFNSGSEGKRPTSDWKKLLKTFVVTNKNTKYFKSQFCNFNNSWPKRKVDECLKSFSSIAFLRNRLILIGLRVPVLFSDTK